MSDAGGAVPVQERYFEDYTPGMTDSFGCVAVTGEEIIRFARDFDPQPMHTDPDAAARSLFGGLIASGWHTASLAMRMLVDHYLSHTAVIASPGVDELRWLKPVRPGDVLRVRATVRETRRSRSRPDRGVVRTYIEVRNQQDEAVMSMIGINFVRCRDTASGAEQRE